MNEMQQAAYIQAQASCAVIEMIGKALDVLVKESTGTVGQQYQIMANEVLEKYGIHHNTVIAFFNGHHH